MLRRFLSKPNLKLNNIKLFSSKISETAKSSGIEKVHHTLSGRKRFYKNVDIEEILPDNKWKVLLDGRELKSPARNPMHFNKKHLAWLVASEWDAQINQKKGIQPATMPFMTLTSTAIDQILPDSTFTIKTIMSYLRTDTMLFFTNEEDRILLEKQNEHFQPLLNWYKEKWGIELSTANGIVSRVDHSDDVVKRIENVIYKLDHYELACLQSATMECKSILMAFAILFQQIDLANARITSRLEEEFQIEIWGAVEGGHDMDRLNNAVSLGSVTTYLNLYWGHNINERVDELLE